MMGKTRVMHPSANALALRQERRTRSYGIAIVFLIASALLSATPTAASGANINTHGGPVATSPHVYEIFWGGNWNSEPAAALRARLESMYAAMSGSAWEGILTQYWAPEAPSPEKGTKFGYVGSTVERTAYTDTVHDGAAPTEVDAAKMRAEIRKAAETNGWPKNPPASSQFVVFPGPGSKYTSAFLATNSNCAWHTYGSETYVGQVAYDWIGYGRRSESSEAEESENAYWYCAMMFAASHEYSEAATDPLLNSWGRGSEEVGDRCSEGSTSLAGIEVTKLWDKHLGSEGQCAAEDANPPKVPPELLTEAPTVVHSTDATLKATFNPDGFVAENVYFEWGTTTSYGHYTTFEHWSHGQSKASTSFSLKELTSNTKYHYRLAVEAVGFPQTRIYGNDREFETGPPKNLTLPSVTPTTPYEAVPETVNSGSWSGEGLTYSYQWRRCNASGEACANIAGAIGATYTPGAGDVASTLRVVVTAKSSGGEEATATSAATNSVVAAGQVTEYTLASGSSPEGIAAGPDGNLWLPAWGTHKIVKMTTAGVPTEYSIPEKSGPLIITKGPDGNMWFTERLANKVGKITPAGTITEYSLPAGSEPYGITSGPDGNLWFTDGASSKISKMTTSGSITEYALPKESYPAAISSGPDGNLWFMGSGKISKITTSGTVTEYPLGKGNSGYGLVAGPDGKIWYTQTHWNQEAFKYESEIVKITTSGTATEYALSTRRDPWGIVAGPDGNLWFAENCCGTNVGRITTSGAITEFPVGTGTSFAITVGSDNRLWFTKPSTSKIGAITP